MIVFAIETSCDETSVCILNDKKDILDHIVYSQSEHQKFGGVIPELASRSHLQILQSIQLQPLFFSIAKLQPGQTIVFSINHLFVERYFLRLLVHLLMLLP